MFRNAGINYRTPRTVHKLKNKYGCKMIICIYEIKNIVISWGGPR